MPPRLTTAVNKLHATNISSNVTERYREKN